MSGNVRKCQVKRDPPAGKRLQAPHPATGRPLAHAVPYRSEYVGVADPSGLLPNGQQDADYGIRYHRVPDVDEEEPEAATLERRDHGWRRLGIGADGQPKCLRVAGPAQFLIVRQPGGYAACELVAADPHAFEVGEAIQRIRYFTAQIVVLEP